MSTWGRRGLSRHVRDRILDRDHHTCVLHYDGCTVVATEVDDIIPVSVLGVTNRDLLTDDNRQAVCGHCHHIKTEVTRLAAWKAKQQHRRERLHLPVKPHPGDMRR